MGLAAVEVNAEVSVEVIVLDGLCSVGHSVHGSRVHMAVILYQHSPALPAPVAVDVFHCGRVVLAVRLGVQMIGAAPPLCGEYLSGLDVLDLEGRAFRDLAAAAVKPVEPLRLQRSVRIRTGGFAVCLLRVRGVQLCQGFLSALAVVIQSIAFLEVLDGFLCTVSVITINTAGVISQLLQFLLYLFYRITRITGTAGTIGFLVFFILIGLFF